MARFHLYFLLVVIVGNCTVSVEPVAVGQTGLIHRQQKRSLLSLPTGGNFKVTCQIIVPVLALINNTNSYLWFDFPTTWALPIYKSLNTLYTSFGKIQEKGIELDEEFIDQQKANQERRTIYEYIEGFFDK